MQEPLNLIKNEKRERKQTAQLLPPGITQNMMKKYVVYYREMVYLKNGKQHPREYFKVESHPKLAKPWVSSKSSKIPISEKLEHANQIVTELEQDNNDTNGNNSDCDSNVLNNHESITKRWAKHIPKYTMLRVIRETSNKILLSLVFDRKDNVNGFRWTGVHTFSCDVSDINTDAEKNAISLALQYLGDKIRTKYGADILYK
jgi:hypothetical protein